MILVGKLWKERQRETERGEGAQGERDSLYLDVHSVSYSDNIKFEKSIELLEMLSWRTASWSSDLLWHGSGQTAAFSVWQVGHKPARHVLFVPHTNCLSVSDYQVARKDSR